MTLQSSHYTVESFPPRVKSEVVCYFGQQDVAIPSLGLVFLGLFSHACQWHENILSSLAGSERLMDQNGIM